MQGKRVCEVQDAYENIHVLIFPLQSLKSNLHPTSSWPLKQSQSE